MTAMPRAQARVLMPKMNRCGMFQCSVLTISAGSIPHCSSFEFQDAAPDQMQQQEQLVATDPPAAAYSPNRPLITNKSNKLEWQEGQLLLYVRQF